MTPEATPDTGTETPASEPTPEAPPPAPESDTDTTDWKAEADKWKTQARKHEDRAKANASAAKELDAVRQSSMSDLEKAVAAARSEAFIEARRESGSRLVDAEVRAAVAGRTVDVDALLEGLDRTRFLDDDGEPDQAAITSWVDRIVPKPEEGFPDLGQGVRTTGSTALNGDPLERDLKAKLGIR